MPGHWPQVLSAVEHISHPKAVTEGQMMDCGVTGKRAITSIWSAVDSIIEKLS